MLSWWSATLRGAVYSAQFKSSWIVGLLLLSTTFTIALCSSRFFSKFPEILRFKLKAHYLIVELCGVIQTYVLHFISLMYSNRRSVVVLICFTDIWFFPENIKQAESNVLVIISCSFYWIRYRSWVSFSDKVSNVWWSFNYSLKLFCFVFKKSEM